MQILNYIPVVPLFSTSLHVETKLCTPSTKNTFNLGLSLSTVGSSDWFQEWFLILDSRPIAFPNRFSNRTDALVLCEAAHLSSFLAGLEEDATVMVIVNRMTKAQIEQYKASRTQLVVDDQGKEKIITAHAVTSGNSSVSAVQNAWKINVIQSEVVWGTLRVREDLTSEENFASAHKKDSLAEYLGKYVKHVTVTGRKVEENPSAVRWSLQIPRAF